MLVHFMPSEIARLVLGYIKEIGCVKTIGVFLAECKHLSEYFECLQSGHEYPTSIGGKSLRDILQEYCRLKSDETVTPPVDNLTPLVHQLEDLLPKLKQVVVPGARYLQPTPFKAISHHSTLQKTRTRCAIVEAQRHTIDDVQPCSSRDASISSHPFIDDVITPITGVASTAATITGVASTAATITGNTNATVVTTARSNGNTVFITATSGGTCSRVVAGPAGNATAGVARVADGSNLTVCTTSNTNTDSATVDTINPCITTAAITVTGTTTTTTVSVAGAGSIMVTEASSGIAATSILAPVSLLKDSVRSKPLHRPSITVEDIPAAAADSGSLIPSVDELMATSEAADEVPVVSNDDGMMDGAEVWTSDQNKSAETEKPVLIDRACSPLVIENSYVDLNRPSTSTGIQHSHPPLCTPVKFGIFSEDSNFRSPRRKCQLPKRRNAQTPSQSAKKRNQVVQDEDSTTSLDCQSEESIDLSGLLGQLISNTALHEKLAENINKVVSTSAPMDTEEIVMETPEKVVTIMPPPPPLPVPSSPAGSLLDTPSKELIMPESLIKDIVDRTESDPMFEELLTSFFDNIKFDSNTSSLDSMFAETLPSSCANTSDPTQLQQTQHHPGEHAIINNDISVILNSHSSPDILDVEKREPTPLNTFSFPHNMQSSPVDTSMVNVASEVCVDNGGEVSEDLVSWKANTADTGSSKDKAIAGPVEETEGVHEWTETTAEAENVPSIEICSPTNLPLKLNKTIESDSLSNVVPVRESALPTSNDDIDLPKSNNSESINSQHPCTISTSALLNPSSGETAMIGSNSEQLQVMPQDNEVHPPVIHIIESSNDPDFSTLQLLEPEVLVVESPHDAFEPINSDSDLSLQTPYKSSQESVGSSKAATTPNNSNSNAEPVAAQNRISSQIHLIVTKTTPAKEPTLALGNNLNVDVPEIQPLVTASADVPTYKMRSLEPISLEPVVTSSSNLNSSLPGNKISNCVFTVASSPSMATTLTHSRLPQVVLCPRDWNKAVVTASPVPISNSRVLMPEPRINVMGDQPLLVQSPNGGLTTVLMPTFPGGSNNQVLMTIPGANGTSTLQLISVPPPVSDAFTSNSINTVIPKLPIPPHPLKGSTASTVRKRRKPITCRAAKRSRPKHAQMMENNVTEVSSGHSTSSTVIARNLDFCPSGLQPKTTPAPVITSPHQQSLVLPHTMRNVAKPTVVQHIATASSSTTTTTIITTTTRDTHTSLLKVGSTTSTLLKTQTTSVATPSLNTLQTKSTGPSILRRTTSTKMAAALLPSEQNVGILYEHNATAAVESTPVSSKAITSAVPTTNTPTVVSAFQSTSHTVSIVKSMPTFKTNARNSTDVAKAPTANLSNVPRTTPGQRLNESHSPQLKSLVNSVRRAASMKPRGNHIRVLDFTSPPKQHSAELHFTPKRRGGGDANTSEERRSNAGFSFFPANAKCTPKRNKLPDAVSGDKLKDVVDQISQKKTLSDKTKTKSDSRSKKSSKTPSTIETQSSNSSKRVPSTTKKVASHSSKSHVTDKSQQSAKPTSPNKLRRSPRKGKRKQVEESHPAKKHKSNKVSVLTAMDVDNFLSKLHYVE